MKKKILGIISLVCLLFFSVVSEVDASIKSKNDINNLTRKLSNLSQMDMASLINKSELIGRTRNRFQLYSSQYQKKIASTNEVLQNISSSIDIVNNSADFSDTEKKMQIQKLYKEAETALGTVDTLTLDYVVSLNMLPSLTHQRFIKKFLKYYNDLNITEQNLEYNM